MPESKRRRLPGRRTSGRSMADAALSLRPKKKKTNYFLLSAFVLIALLVIGSFGLTTIPFGSGANLRVGKNAQYVEGVGVSQKLMPTATHISESLSVEYNTVPATSGDHWALWADCGFYEKGLPDERVVHNLEHSNIVVSYNLTAAADIEALRAAVEDVGLSRAWGVTRFYDKVPPGTVALTAWGILDTMEGVDKDRIKKFYETYAGKIGPEKNAQGIGIPC
ncbi:MAG: DUF3105 domain-containing protein [Dehalococcoidia bacterium]|nr:DUF3105 domain-containing protein [Dehalococcoidia bacterium]MSQ17042.1 DUF3105 domain-containing protein [Dehalococcoidia bacterium]